MLKPVYTFLFLALIGLLFVFILLFSVEKLPITNGFVIKVPTWASIFQSPNKNLKQTDSLLDVAQKLDSIHSFSIQEKKDESIISRIKKFGVNKSIQSIEYDGHSAKKELVSFFQSLDALSNNEDSLFRVLHYGDSQLDGDRITEYLRSRLQSFFGGCGVGYLPISTIENIRLTLKQSSTPNWIKYSNYSENEYKPRHSGYSILGSFFSLKEDSLSYGSVRYYPSKYGNKLGNHYEKLTTYFWARDNSFRVDYDIPSLGLQKGFIMKRSTSPSSFTLKKEGDLGVVRLSFSNVRNATIYGASFDCNNGIAVDNIPMRGSAFSFFSKINANILKSQLHDLNARLIILQFGINVVSEEIKNYGYYEKMISSELNYIKKLYPNLSIVLIGVSDMARKDQLSINTYPNIPLIIEAQRNAAFKNGCAFWNLYEAMGGENTIVAWVNSKPALAQKDYTHFTRSGAKIVGEMIFNALMKEYLVYLEEKSS